MSDYTPTTEEVEGYYMQGVAEFGPTPLDPDFVEGRGHFGEFGRWLNTVRAQAWDEGYEDARADEHEHRPGRKHTNPYKEKP